MSFKGFVRKRNLVFFVTLLLAVALLFTSCVPSVIDAINPSKDKHKELQAESVKDVAGEVVDIYEKLLSMNSKKANGFDISVDLELSDELFNLIKIMGDIDLSWLSKIGAELSVSEKDSVIGVDAGLKISNSELLGLACIFDMNEGAVYATIPGIISKYVSVDVPMDEISQVSISTEGLPSADKVEALLDKYIDLAIGALGEAEKSSGTLAANGVEQKCTVYETEITERIAMDLVKTVVQEAVKDTKLKDVIVAFGDWAAKTAENAGGYVDFDGESIYEEFVNSCNYTLESINEEYDAALENDEVLLLTTYADGDDVIGRRVAFDGEVMFSYGFAENKGSFGYELEYAGDKTVVGEGTLTAKKLSGSYTFMKFGEDIITVEVKDLDRKKLDDGQICGTFEFSIGDTLADMMDESVASIFSVYKIRAEVDASEKGAKLVLALMSGESYFVKLTINAEETKAKAPAIPSASDVIDVVNMEDPSELLAAIDFDELFERLETVGVPKEYLDMIEQYLAYLQYFG